LTVYGVDSLLTVYDVDKTGSFWTKLDRRIKERGGFSSLQTGKKRWGAEGGIPSYTLIKKNILVNLLSHTLSKHQ
jgi:hypothetical protein